MCETQLYVAEDELEQKSQEETLIKEEYNEEERAKDFVYIDEIDSYYNKKRKVEKRILSVLDILLSLFIVTPLVVAGWRGAWELMDIYGSYFPAFESFWTGIFAHVVLALAQECFHNIFMESENNWKIRIFTNILTKLYTFVFTIITNMHWRGGWDLLDAWFGVELDENAVPIDASACVHMLVFCGACLIIISLMKCLTNVTSPPFQICHDKGNDMFLFPTMFKTNISEKTSLYILDCLFSVLVVGTLVVFVWRGFWVLVDIYLFPENIVWSSWGSLILGYSIVAVVFLMQPVMRTVCTKLTGAPRLFAADCFIIISLMGTINVWRGIWNLLDIYFIPENPELSCWITLWVSLIVLILLGCSNSLLVRGVFIDAEEPEGKCVVFPCYYLRLIFQEEKLKKLHLQTLQMSQKIDKIVMENNHIIAITTISDKVEGNHNREGC